MTHDENKKKKKKVSFARRKSKLPMRVYSYGALPPFSNPDKIEAQLHWLHIYYNHGVNIAHQYRRKILAANALDTSMANALAVLTSLKEQEQAARAAVKGKRAGRGRRANVSTEVKAYKDLQAKVTSAREHYKKMKAQVNANPVVQEAKEAAEAWKTAEWNRLYHTCPVLHWGTKNAVQKSVLQAEVACPGSKVNKRTGEIIPWHELPEFRPAHRYGEGALTAQIPGGTSVPSVLEGATNQIQIDPVPEDTFDRPRNQRRKASRTRARIRIGTEPGKAQAPTWAEARLILHRPLPPDGTTKVAKLIRYRVGYEYRHLIQLSVEAESLVRKEPCQGTGRVAVDLGWRRMAGGKVRVAFWRDENGDTGEVTVPDRTVQGLEYVESLQSVRDLRFNEFRDKIVAWAPGVTHPDAAPVKASLRHAASWKNVRSLVKLQTRWTKHRFPGDDEMFTALGKEITKDRHLYRWISWQRERRQNHRKDEYRCLANKFLRQYAEIVLENFDLRDTAKHVPVEKGPDTEGQEQRRTAKIAAPGELRTALIGAAGKHGLKVTKVPAAYTTLKCWSCGAVDKDWEPKKSLMHTCSLCGETWDQDDNACRNLLAAADTKPPEPEGQDPEGQDPEGQDPEGQDPEGLEPDEDPEVEKPEGNDSASGDMMDEEPPPLAAAPSSSDDE